MRHVASRPPQLAHHQLTRDRFEVLLLSRALLSIGGFPATAVYDQFCTLVGLQ